MFIFKNFSPGFVFIYFKAYNNAYITIQILQTPIERGENQKDMQTNSTKQRRTRNVQLSVSQKR